MSPLRGSLKAPARYPGLKPGATDMPPLRGSGLYGFVWSLAVRFGPRTVESGPLRCSKGAFSSCFGTPLAGGTGQPDGHNILHGNALRLNEPALNTSSTVGTHQTNPQPV